MRNTQDELCQLQGRKVQEGKLLTITTHVRCFLMITSMLSGCLIGLLTSNTKLFTESIRMSESIAAVIVNPFVYLSGAMVIACLSSNFYNLNVTMSMYSQLYVLPFYESCSICFNLVSGLVLMGEFELYTALQLSCIFIGCLISVTGILLKLLVLEAYDDPKSTNTTQNQ